MAGKKTMQHPPSLGSTLLEILVAIGIVGILVSLALPAIGASRSYAERSGCANKLKQFGIALANYENVHGMYPAGRIPVATAQRNDFSLHSRLLPFFEQSSNTEWLNFEAGYAVSGRGPLNQFLKPPAELKPISSFICPTEANTQKAQGAVNYRACIGPDPSTSKPFFNHDHGPFSLNVCRRVRDIPDGLANTAFVSERVLGDFDSGVYSANRDYWFTNGPSVVVPNAYFISACQLFSSPNPPHFSEMGNSWMDAGLRSTAYNHVFGPNSEVPDCAVRDSGSNVFGAVGARSGHFSGVNVLYGDGTVHFIENGVDLAIWLAISTRDGGETETR